MAEVRYIIESNYDLGLFGPAFDRESLISMTDVVKIIEASVELNMPRDVGTAQRGVKKNVETLRDATQGDVYDIDDPAKLASIESGRRAGSFPQLRELSQWAARKGIAPSNIFALGRSIAAKGIAPRRVFQRSADETGKDVDRILGDVMIDRILKGLEK